MSVCLSIYLSVCLHSHGLISCTIFAKSGTGVTTPKSKIGFFEGSTSHHPFPCTPKYRHVGPKGPENPRKYKYANFCLKYSRISEICALYRKMGSRNTMMTSDFRPEVEISQFRTCALKNDCLSVAHNGLSYGSDTTFHRTS